MTAFDSIHDRLDMAIDRHEHDYYHLLVELTDNVIAARDISSLAEKTADYLHAFFGLDFISVEIADHQSFNLDAFAVLYDQQNHRINDNYSIRLHPTSMERDLRSRNKYLFNRSTMMEYVDEYPFLRNLIKNDVQALLHIPLYASDDFIGALSIGTRRHSHFTPDIMELLDRVANRLAMSISVIQIHKNSVPSHKSSIAENLYITQTVEEPVHHVIGKSAAIQSILHQIKTVASYDATVLLQGETGTGKGLVAQTIHDLSNRHSHEMIKMNCTAIPSELMESELFGHEKGAFTGALNRRIGHFEQADKSTLFLDEIGDMPIDLQPKILSVLQERQIRRLGSLQIIPVDIRFIAATNCNLPQKIEDKTFRSDLFYRLNVFPITIPPLRERAEDIPHLTRYFVSKYANRMNLRITTIPENTLDMMMRLPWPGNIRELENVVERAVILTGKNPVLNLTPESLSNFTSKTLPAVATTTGHASSDLSGAVPETGRDAIVSALEKTHGKIGGKAGAAALLGLKRTTLLARIKRLGINADMFRDPNED